MDLYNMTPHQAAVIDCAGVVGMAGSSGFILLLAAFYGTSWMRRYAALLAANIVLLVPVALSYATRSVTPYGLWEGATLWRQYGTLFGDAVAISTWWVLLSPFMSLLSLTFIERAKWKWRITQMQRSEGLDYN